MLFTRKLLTLNTPLLSIITVTYNNLSGLKRTIENVSHQFSNNFEHVIIDGNSTDNTKDYLNSLQNENLKWTSEKDNGIYDAMNKGINNSIGTWIIFMNAGDEFNTSFSLKNIPFSLENKVIYGDCDITYPTGYSRTMKAAKLSQLWKGLPFSHQSVIVHRSLIKKGFNTDYKYCADFYFFFNHYKNEKKWKYIPHPISRITAGGVSDQKRYLSTNEVYLINKKINSSFKIHFYFIPKIIISFIIVKLKSVLPKKWINTLYKIKY